MNISTPQIEELAVAIRAGLVPLSRPLPMTPVEWADADDGFYLSSESSYQEGKWETLAFQVAILNAMGNDEIRTVNVIKSARVGYSKMLLAASAYQIEHKRRNILLLLPTDGAAQGFMKAHVETMIRDVPSIYALAPWYGKKHRDNTLDTKRFSHSKQLWCLGGAAAKNYREKSVDTIIYDELAAFEPDVEKEGSPTFLGDKRIEGSTFPKSIRGSTPKIKGTCQIEAAASESPHLFRLHVPCPHCQAEQYLKWGGKDCAYGIKWDPESPGTAWYLPRSSASNQQNMPPPPADGYNSAPESPGYEHCTADARKVHGGRAGCAGWALNHLQRPHPDPGRPGADSHRSAGVGAPRQRRNAGSHGRPFRSLIGDFLNDEHHRQSARAICPWHGCSAACCPPADPGLRGRQAKPHPQSQGRATQRQSGHQPGRQVPARAGPLAR